jgi:hypothetical protein
MVKNIQPGIFSEVVLLYQHVKYTTIGDSQKKKPNCLGPLSSGSQESLDQFGPLTKVLKNQRTMSRNIP